MADEINKNLLYLTESITNINKILIKLIERGIFSYDEHDEIMKEDIGSQRNFKLLRTIIRKDWRHIRKLFLGILRETNNGHCADKIEGNEEAHISKKRKVSLLSKWWPEEKLMVKSFYERKEDGKLLVEDLESKIIGSNNGMTVISQKVTVSGLGGVGKTTTAKWFANYFSKNYDHIIWIDCGEGSLIESFKKLARDLDLEGSDKFDLQELARKSFKKLELLKCLWIYDNAECYVGNQGIRQFLPKKENFHTIITSRNRDWGSENGDGKICEFLLDTFETAESVDFLKKNIKNFESDTNYELEILCDLLGNLPLALQIAVATINGSRINITEYIQRIRKTDDIIHSLFDDYEKTINKTMKISLDIIKDCEGKSGDLAYKMLTTFGYIKPDFVSVNFFENVEDKTFTEVLAAGDILEKYSLITKTEIKFGDTTNSYINNHINSSWVSYSIHRLFQQVIRHNEKFSADDTLRKILSCEGYLDFKLIPYTFASDGIKQEFPYIKAELIDQLELKQLSTQRRFQEATDLSLIIHNTLKTSSSLYNYASCLENNGEILEALAIFENMYNEVPDGKMVSYGQNSNGVMDLGKEPTRGLVAGKLFIIFWKRKELVKALEILKKQNHLIFKYTVQSLHDVMKSLSSINIIGNYFLNCHGLQEFYYLELRNETFVKQMQLEYCSIMNTAEFPQGLQRIRLSELTVIDENGKKLERFETMNVQFPKNLLYLFSGSQINKRSTKLVFSTDQLSSVEYLELLPGNELVITPTKIAPKSLKLNCTVTSDGQIPTKITLNDFIDFSQTMFLQIINVKTELGIIMTDSVQIDSIYLNVTSVLDWTTAKWVITELILNNVSFVQKTQLRIKELEMENSSVNLAFLPSSLQRLSLDTMTEVISSEQVVLSELNYLQLYDQDPVCLSEFANCLNLTHLVIVSHFIPIELDADKIPENVKKIKLSQLDNEIIFTNTTRVIQLDTLILQGYSPSQIQTQSDSLTKIFHPAHLVIFFNPEIKWTSVVDIIPLIQTLFNSNPKEHYVLKTITLGEFIWESNSFVSSSFSKYVNTEAQYYLFQKPDMGTALQKHKFKKVVDMTYYSLQYGLSKLESQEERLKTFKTWKISFLSAEYCSKAGFFYLQCSDKLQCAFCEKMTFDIQPGTVLHETRSHFDYCPLINTSDI